MCFQPGESPAPYLQTACHSLKTHNQLVPLRMTMVTVRRTSFIPMLVPIIMMRR